MRNYGTYIQVRLLEDLGKFYPCLHIIGKLVRHLRQVGLRKRKITPNLRKLMLQLILQINSKELSQIINNSELKQRIYKITNQMNFCHLKYLNICSLLDIIILVLCWSLKDCNSFFYMVGKPGLESFFFQGAQLHLPKLPKGVVYRNQYNFRLLDEI